jgi:hypothetical protein
MLIVVLFFSAILLAVSPFIILAKLIDKLLNG